MEDSCVECLSITNSDTAGPNIYAGLRKRCIILRPLYDKLRETIEFNMLTLVFEPLTKTNTPQNPEVDSVCR